jgi:hypothetical protein
LSILLYRWQDKDGRGPYRPGMSRYWADQDNQANNPPFFQEFGMDITKQCRPGEAMGCAFRTIEQMRQWFTDAERQRMRLMGYEFGCMEADRVIAESERQVVFARRKPFRLGFTLLDSEAIAA